MPTSTSWQVVTTLNPPLSSSYNANAVNQVHAVFVNWAILHVGLDIIGPVVGVIILWELTLWFAHIIWRWARGGSVTTYYGEGFSNGYDTFIRGREE